MSNEQNVASPAPVAKTPDQEMFIEIAYKRGYNLGKFGDIKEYSLKISGNQSIVEDQIRFHKNRLTKYVSEVESLIEDANKINVAKAEAERVLAAAAAQATQVQQ